MGELDKIKAKKAKTTAIIMAKINDSSDFQLKNGKISNEATESSEVSRSNISNLAIHMTSAKATKDDSRNKVTVQSAGYEIGSHKQMEQNTFQSTDSIDPETHTDKEILSCDLFHDP